MFLQAHCPSACLHVAEEFTVPNNEQPQAMMNKYWDTSVRRKTKYSKIYYGNVQICELNLLRVSDRSSQKEHQNVEAKN